MGDVNKTSRIIQECHEQCDIDLVVLSCNGSDTTRDFIQFFSENTPEGMVHLLWVDNGSTDDSVDVLSGFATEYKYMTLMINSENLGVIGGRNIGYAFAKANKPKSKYMMFLDNDQYVKKGWIEQHLNFLETGYGVVGVEAWQMNNRFLPIKRIDNIKEFFTYVGCGGMLIKREIVDKIGMFDMRFNPSYFEDPDYNFRVHNADYKIGWNYKAGIVHMPHQTLGKLSHQEKALRFGRSLRLFREKWKGYKPPRFYQ